jgi:hypothetical protein
LVLTALALVTLLAVAGLAIDMGVMRYDKRVQQTAADAAAIAAATDISSGTWQTAGQDASSNNGFTDSGSGNSLSPCYAAGASVGMVCVEIDSPPKDGPHSTDKFCPSTTATCDLDYAEARVAKVQPTFFMKIFGVESETVVARAVATDWSGVWGNGNNCIITTGPPSTSMSANNAGLGATGSVILNAPTCGIQDDGNLIANGGTNLSIDSASINVAYGYNGPSKSDCSSDPVVGVCPPPSSNTGVVVPDPLYNVYPIPATTPSSGPVKITEGSTGAVCTGAGCTNNVVCSGSNCTINPGIYDDICIESSGLTVDFGETTSLATGGVYVLTGASTCSNSVDFHVTGGATVCNSTNTDCSGMPGSANSGVTFYLAGTTASAFIAGTATAQLTAPCCGGASNYEGLLFYQALDNPTTMSLLGTSSSFYQGAIYEADSSAQLYFGGNAGFNSEAAYTLIDVGQLTMAGNPDITINSNYSSLGGGGGPLAGMINSAILVE